MSLAAGIVARVQGQRRDNATTVLRRAEQHTPSSAQAASDAQGKSGAPLPIWSKRHYSRTSLRYWKSCGGQSSAHERALLDSGPVDKI